MIFFVFLFSHNHKIRIKFNSVNGFQLSYETPLISISLIAQVNTNKRNSLETKLIKDLFFQFEREANSAVLEKKDNKYKSKQ